MGDFNNDGNIDIAATISSTNSVMVLLGDGTGRFTERPDGKIPTITGDPSLIFPTDYNEDRNTDLIVTTSSEIVLFAGDGQGNFVRSNIPPPGGPVAALIPADMNRDGHIDLVTTQSSPPGTVSVLLGNGRGSLRPQRAPLSLSATLPWRRPWRILTAITFPTSRSRTPTITLSVCC